MNCFVILSLLLPSIFGEQLISFQSDEMTRQVDRCNEVDRLTCNKVTVNMKALLDAEVLELPHDLALKLTRTAPGGDQDTLALTFENEAEHAQGVFVMGDFLGKSFLSGTVNWAKAGRHFKLEMCTGQRQDDDCYTWSEVNTKSWVNEASLDGPHGEDRDLSEDQLRLLASGRADTTTMAYITVTAYTSASFRASFNNDATQMRAFINQAVAESNQGYVNSKVPITMSLKCVLASSVLDNVDSGIMLSDFLAASKNDYNGFRKSADLAVLLTATDVDSCGMAYTNVLSNGQTLGVVKKSCATGYYSFGHEIAHMVGALHNREAGSVNNAYPAGYGFLMQPPVSSGFRTILAYPATGYNTRVNYYSNPNVLYQSKYPTGTATSNNAALLTERRFLFAATGNEALTC